MFRRSGAFLPKVAPEVLWAMDPQRRPILIESQYGTRELIVALAGGNRVYGPLRALDSRATIRGGIAAMKAAGHDVPAPRGLDSRIRQDNAADTKLIRAAGGGRNLEGAAERVRARVRGLGLSRAAWGYRGLYVLDAAAGVKAAESTATAAVSVIPIWGQIIGAAAALKSGVSGKAESALRDQLKAWSKTAAQQRPIGTAETLPVPVSTPATTAAYPSWLVPGMVILGVTLAVLGQWRKRSKS